MITLFLVIVFIFIYTITHLQLKEMVYKTNLTINPLALLLSLSIFFILIPFFFKGYLTATIFIKYVFAFMLLLVGGILGYIVFFNSYSNMNYEGIKSTVMRNTIVIFLKTLFPLLVFLTILRFQHPLVQILGSITLVVLFYLLSFPLQKIIKKIRSKLAILDEIDFRDSLKITLGVLGIVLVVGMYSLVYQIPTNTLEENLNLSNHISFFSAQTETIYQKNNYTVEKIYTEKIEPIPYRTIYNNYTYEDNTLTLRYIRPNSSSDDLDLSQGITTKFDGYTIFQDNEVIIVDNIYEFPYLEEFNYYYNQDNNSMYYTETDERYELSYQSQETNYTRIDRLGNRIDVTLPFIHNTTPLITENELFLLGGTQPKRVEIMNEDLEMTAFYKHTFKDYVRRKPFRFNSFIIEYKIVDGDIEFLQYDNDGTLTLNRLIDNKVYIDLPIYSSYSLKAFIWIFIGMSIPLKNISLISLFKRKNSNYTL